MASRVSHRSPLEKLRLCGAVGCIAMALVTVLAVRVTAETGGDLLPTRGVVKAIHKAALSSELTAMVQRIGFREGERFREGNILIEFDCQRQMSELEALAASVREAKVAVDANAHLIARGAASRSDVAVAKARYEKAMAEWQALRQSLSGCRITAPWDGVVTELSISAYETSLTNRPLITIATDRQLEIDLIVPSRMLPVLRPGGALIFSVDEIGKMYPARITRIGGAVDPVSQTIKIMARFEVPPEDVLPGMSGSARFSPSEDN